MHSLSPLIRISAVLFVILFTSNSAIAASARADYDLDDDGLIEIDDLSDLDEIRNNLDGTTLYGVNTGCPGTGCNGFELTTDLDFDTNSNGTMDANDTYWNSGSGWEPLGSNSSNAFTATFEGNGHLIRNLYIYRSTNYIGLFGLSNGALIRNVGLTGNLMQVSGLSYAGGLVGYAFSSTSISSCFSTGSVSATSTVSNAGGLVGYLKANSSIIDSFATGSVTGRFYIGGLTGFSENSTINDSFATNAISGENSIGGLVGNGSSNTITNSYWATDSTGQTGSYGSSISNGYLGDTLTNLQCPTTPDDNSCGSNTLYAGWSSTQWDFGTSSQLPGLIISSSTYRDTDGDGVLDNEDIWPALYAASRDADVDGHPDAWSVNCDENCITASGLELDQFPDSAAAWQDDDLDGLPDSWAISCDIDCQTASGLTLDTYLDDFDNDGLNTATDTDDDGDGLTDADFDSDGLIDIESLAELDAVRFNLRGLGLVFSNGGSVDSSGCPPRIYQGRALAVCQGYELNVDLNFDTNSDGVMDANDSYWNAGSGWEPLGSDSNPFATTFEGNGHLIRNLYIDRSMNHVGLFGYSIQAVIRNVGLTGNLMQVTGSSYVGGLVGSASFSTSINSSFSTGAVKSTATFSYVGGLVGGLLINSSVDNTFSTGTVSGFIEIGGLIGRSVSSTINNSLATGIVSGPNSAGGLLGYSTNSTITNSYWATDSTGQTGSYGSSISNGYLGDTLTNLQCPTTPDDNSCGSNTLYAGWSSTQWDFGTSSQLPGLIISSSTYRDTDSDGVLDTDDAWPNLFAASRDTDADGYPDAWNINCNSNCISTSGLVLDQFPYSAAAWQDDDLDGLPDGWASGCDNSCQTTSGLTLDSYLDDFDNDGLNTATDTDDDGDGLTDADADSDGLIDINSLAELDAIRFSLQGRGQILSSGGTMDSSGCPSGVYQGTAQPLCHGYELNTDLDFDTNGDGVMDTRDSYWNSGSGWEPLGLGTSTTYAFAASFEGNGHLIRNLYIDRPTSAYIGLFGYSYGANFHNIGLTGDLMQITGSSYVGGLAGIANSTNISSAFSTGSVSAFNGYGGGLTGSVISNSTISNSFTSGSVTGSTAVGGLVGRSLSSTISNSFAIAAVSGTSLTGGLVGTAFSSTINNSYWATDTTGQNSSASSSASNGDTLANLQCPTTPDSSCNSNTLYIGWNTIQWDFGSTSQLPGLILSGKVYRDTDGDGVLDVNDAFPLDSNESVDTDGDGTGDNADTDDDGDGVLDINDAFPLDSSEYVDTDGDGTGNNADTDDDGDGMLDVDDAFPLDSSETLDTDSDGIGNNSDTDDDGDGVLDVDDAFPLDSSETLDTDSDGIGNNSDTDDDGDGVLDVNDAFPLDSTESVDTDGDGIGNNADTDDDGDGVLDVNDAFPLDNTETLDTDSDGIGNNADPDDDNDGVLDADDAFPLDATGSLPEDDIDTDDDGLIELYTLADFNAIRDDLAGRSLLGVTAGCPEGGCIGYELMADLDFDSNADGVIDVSDNYWNDGEGWLPVGSDSNPFSAEFDGNGHVLRNLYIDRTSTSYIGLFGYINGAVRIHNLGITGPLTQVKGYEYVGLLAGFVYNSGFEKLFGQGSVSGTVRVAGLIGHIEQSGLLNSYSQGSVTGVAGSSLVAGLVAEAYDCVIGNTYTATTVKGDMETGGLVASSSNALVTTSYWDTEVSTQATSVNGNGNTSSEMKCPQSPGDSNCAETLYSVWSETLWDFGSTSQYPALIFNGVVFRDTDNDGTQDVSDAFPLDPTETLDSDNDGIGNNADPDDDNDGTPDTQDAFPNNDAASIDADNDGLPDSWNSNCDSSCQQNSGLTLDSQVGSGNSGSSSSSGGGGGGSNSPFMLLFLLGMVGVYQFRQRSLLS